MNRTSSIQWTDTTWNPVRGCSRISPGCGGPGPHGGCYAETQALRIYRMDRGRGVPIGEGSYDGLVTMVGGRECDTCAGAGRGEVQAEFGEWCPTCFGLGRLCGEARWTGAVRLVPEQLDAPLRMRTPRRIFVNSMSDLFHERLSIAEIYRVLDVCALAVLERGHTLQILTKRAQRMSNVVREWMQDRDHTQPPAGVWFGVSVENQEQADLRIRHLLETPAAVRFLSCEPLLGPIQLGVGGAFYDYGVGGLGRSGIDLAIIGGESGPRARPCNLAWLRSLICQCRDAGVACFVKQLGARPVVGAQDSRMCTCLGTCRGRAGLGPGWGCAIEGGRLNIRDSHGADPAEWPEDLRVRELPA